jgi:hypothetical protein
MSPNKNTQHYLPDRQPMSRRLLPAAFVLSGALVGAGLHGMQDEGMSGLQQEQAISEQPTTTVQEPFIKNESVMTELPQVVHVETAEAEDRIIVPLTTTTVPQESINVESPSVRETTITTTTTIPTPKPILPLESTTTTTKPAVEITEVVSDTTLPEVDLDTAPDTTLETTPDTLPEIMPETENIPESARQLLAENTVYIPYLGCSGYIIRNQDGKPIGAATAEHCGLRSIVRPRLTDANAVRYAEFYEQIDVFTGETVSELESVATVGSAILPSETDEAQDLALLVFENEDPEEVYESFDRAPTLSRGDVAYLSGWPIDQDNNASGEVRRQEWAMDYLGPIELTTTAGETLEGIQLFALKSNGDGAECSFGSSGSIAITEDGTEIGALAVFDEFIPDTWQITQENADSVREFYESYFGVDLSGYTNVCGFSPKQLAYEEMDLIELRKYKVDAGEGVIGDDPPSYEENPDQTETTDRIIELRDKALGQFHDPDIPKTFVDGIFEGLIGKGGPGSNNYVENPLVYTGKAGDTILYWTDSGNKSGFSYYYIPKEDNLHITVNRLAGDTESTAFEQTSGVIDSVGFNGNVALQDEQKNIFGHTVGSVDESLEKWTFTIVEGQPMLIPYTDRIGDLGFEEDLK